MNTCRQCNFCVVKGDKIICERNKNINILFELDYDRIDIPCHAGEPDTYNFENEYIRPDMEVDYGYLEDDWMYETKYVFRCIRIFN